MSSERDDGLNPPEPPFERDRFPLPEPARRQLSRSRVAVAVVALSAFAVFTWYAYDSAMSPGDDGPAPLIKADKSPTRVRPETPGGMKVPNQDKLVYERLASGKVNPQVEHLLPPPETPLPAPTPGPVGNGPSGGGGGPSGTAGASGVGPVAVGPVPPPEPLMTPAASAAKPSPLMAAEAEKLANIAPAAGGGAHSPSTQTPVPAPKAQATAKPPAAPATSAKVPAKAPAQTPAKAPPAAERKTTKVGSSPVTAPATAPSSALSPGGGYRVQLAAVRSRKGAKGEWARLRKAHGDLLGSLTLTVEQADLGKKGVFYRVQGGPLTQTAARDVCAKLKRRKAGCFIVKH